MNNEPTRNEMNQDINSGEFLDNTKIVTTKSSPEDTWGYY